LANEEKMITQKQIPRPHLADDLSFTSGPSGKTITWITGVDSKALWADFLRQLDAYQRTHAIVATAKDN
jgi:hypothetical protein